MTVCDAPGKEQEVSMIRDGKGGTVVVWQDDRDVFPDIYAQRIGADGTPRKPMVFQFVPPVVIKPNLCFKAVEIWNSLLLG